MNRRLFVGGLAAALAAGSREGGAETAKATLEISAAASASVPEDFTGLSYESAQLANPDFFAAGNVALVALFRELSPKGNLRLGGGSSEFTTFADEAPAGPPPFEVFGPDTSKTVKSGTVTSALALRNLRGFLEATGWSCLYGLNLGQGTVANAVAEAAAVQKVVGPHLLAFQIGNEPDSFRNRYRPATYTPADYIAEWTRFHNAIAAAVPEAKFAGPDISNKLPYLVAFAEMAARHKDIVLLTSHYYAMGPARNPEATLENLLLPEPKLTTLKDRDLHVIAEAQKTAGLPYRMSEGNSCWDGGKPGVSDTLASALWCADYMMTCMGRGWAGVNLHGGGNGFYTPIAGAPSSGFTRRPEFFGMLVAQRFAGARALGATLTGVGPEVKAFVFERDGKREMAVVNKSADAVNIALPGKMSGEAVVMLQGRSIDAKTGVELKAAKGVRRRREVGVPGYSAAVFALTGGAA